MKRSAITMEADVIQELQVQAHAEGLHPGEFLKRVLSIYKEARGNVSIYKKARYGSEREARQFMSEDMDYKFTLSLIADFIMKKEGPKRVPGAGLNGPNKATE